MIDWNLFAFKAVARVTKSRDGDTIEFVRVANPLQEVEVSRLSGGNTTEKGVPYADEAHAMLDRFIAANQGVVFLVAKDKGGSTSGSRHRWQVLCQDPITDEWFNPLVPMARAGLVVPFANRDEWFFNEPIMIAAQQAMADKLALWSHADSRLRIVCMYNPSGDDTHNEYVDIFNDSDEDVAIGNWSVRSDGAWGYKQRGYAFPEHAHILPHSSVRVWVGRPGVDTHTEFFWDEAEAGDEPPGATFKNLNEDVKSGGMAILVRPDPSMTFAAWDVWPKRI